MTTEKEHHRAKRTAQNSGMPAHDPSAYAIASPLQNPAQRLDGKAAKG